MTDNAKKEIAALRAEVEALKAAQPKPQPTAEERERATREWISEMHAMREGRMSLAMPPSAIRDMAVLDDRLVKEIGLRDARAPTGPSSQGAIPSSQQMSNVHPGGGTGWAREIPLGPSPHQRYVDAQLDAQDARDRPNASAKTRNSRPWRNSRSRSRERRQHCHQKLLQAHSGRICRARRPCRQGANAARPLVGIAT